MPNHEYPISYRTTLSVFLISLAFVTPLSILYMMFAVFPLFDFNNIAWLNIVKHIGYRAIIICLFFVTAFQVFLREKKSLLETLPRSGIEVPILLYLLSIVNSFFWSPSFGSSSLVVNAAAIGSMLLLIGLMYVAMYWLDDTHKISHATRLLILSGLVISILALGQWVVGVYSFYRNIGRLTGIFWDPNIFARYEIILLCYVLSILLVARPRGTTRVFFVSFAVISFACLLLSFSRSGYLTMLVMLLTLLYLEKRNWSLIIGVALVALIGVGGYFFLTEFRASQEGSLLVDASNINRIVLLSGGIQVIREHWLAGVGFANYSLALEQIYAGTSLYFTETYKYSAGIATSIHNWAVEVWAEQGLIGLIAFVWVFVACLKKIHRARAKCKDIWLKAYLTGHLLMIVVFLFHGFFYHTFITQFFFWVLFSLAIATAVVAESPERTVKEVLE